MKREAIRSPIRQMIFRHFGATGISRGLRRHLAEPPLSLNPPQIREDMGAIAWKAGELLVSDTLRTLDPPTRGHLEWGAWMLAGWQVLRPRLQTDEQAITFLGDASMKGIDTRLSRYGLRFLFRSCRFQPDHACAVLTTLLNYSGAACESTVAEDGSGMTIRITKCFYDEFFAAHDAPQLSIAINRLYAFWFTELSPQRHGMRLQLANDAFDTRTVGQAFSIVMERI